MPGAPVLSVFGFVNREIGTDVYYSSAGAVRLRL